MTDSHPIPENFSKVINEFIQDLSTTFPEHLDPFQTELYKKDDPTNYLFAHVVSVLPERFFDIIYQNEDIFKEDSEINTEFLPGVDFKRLFSAPSVSQDTKTAIWKYLQLILFSILQSVKNKNDFGDAMNMFQNIDAEELQSKMRETMEKMADFFTPPPPESQEGGADEQENPSSKPFPGMPDLGEMHNHLKGLFDGKLGQLAKEMAEELSGDFEKLLGEDPNEMRSTQDVMKKLMSDPSKMMDLVKNIGTKLNAKMANNEISQEDLMKEVSEMMGKMKGQGFPGGFPGFPGSTKGGGGGSDTDFMNMFKNMAQQMGGLSGLKRNMRMDTNAMNQVQKKQGFREKMKEKLEKKKQMAAAALALQQQQAQPSMDGKIEQKDNKHFVFKIDGQVQEKSAVEKQKEIEQLMTDLNLTNEPLASKTGANKPKKKKGKK